VSGDDPIDVVLRWAALGTLVGTALTLVLRRVDPAADSWFLPAAGGVVFALCAVVYLLSGVLP